MQKQIKWMFAAILLCGAVMSAYAQSDDLKHEVAVSYEAPGTSTWAKIGAVIGDALVGAKYENSSSFGSLAVEYFYHLDPSVSVGGIVCYTRDKDDILLNNINGDRTTTYLTFMPAIKWNYLRREHFGMYMKAAVGYTLQHINEKYNGKEDSANDGMFNVQISPLGLEAGNAHIRGFFELGFGEQGVALAGLRYKF